MVNRTSIARFPWLVAIAIAVTSCGPTSKSQRYSREKLQETLGSLDTPGIVIGEFNLAAKAIVDGDTIKVSGLDTSLRLLAIDSEETFKREKNRRASEADFDAYLRDLRAKKRRPVKTGTPMGEEAKKWAKKWFEDVKIVRLERDHPKEIRGRYNRYLAYAFARKNGVWLNYNVEHVRAGMSPYFTKYSYSRRFHDEFVAAENEARANKVGIWDPSKQHYPDYDERKLWWDARADFIKEFEKEATTNDDMIVLTHWDAIRRIEQRMRQEVTILATVGDIRRGDRGPTRVLLSRRLFNDFPAIFFDKEVFSSSSIAKYKSEFVRVTGVVNVYQNKYTKKRQLQIIVNLPSQVVGSDKVPGIGEDEGPTASVNTK